MSTDQEKISSDMKRLEKEIQVNEKLFHVSVNHIASTMNRKISQLKWIMDQQRPEYKIYPLSICDLWLRLRQLTNIEALTLVSYLISYYSQKDSTVEQIKRHQRSLQTDEYFLINPKRSRLYHLHILSQSDQFNDDPHGYVGLMVFSYNDQERFHLNKHFIRQGDLLIKKISTFPSHLHQHRYPISRRGIYQTLFKWYFEQNLDGRFVGVGFIYADGQFRFDTITSDYQQLLPFEYRILDLFILTHWLNHRTVAHHVQNMEIEGKELLDNQFRSLQSRLNDSEEIKRLTQTACEMLSSDENTFLAAIEYFQRTTKEEIELLLQLFIKTSISITADDFDDFDDEDDGRENSISSTVLPTE